MVVVRHEKRCQGRCAVQVLEPAPRPCVELVRPVQALDELLALPVFLRYAVGVFQADDSFSDQCRHAVLPAGLRVHLVVGRQGIVVRRSVTDEGALDAVLPSAPSMR